MPNHTVSGNVDTMMRAADNAAIRSAIGVGQTDAPTFLGLALTGTTNQLLKMNASNWFGTDTSQVYLYNSGLASPVVSLNNGSNIAMRYDWGLAWTAGASTGSLDLILARDAAGILAQRNGVNAQAFRVYNTYTDASNYSRLKIGWDSATYTAFTIEGQQLGTGGGRNLALIGGGNVFGMGMNPSSAFNWVINSGNLLAGVDNIHDIGASGANRPRNIYVATGVTSGFLVASDYVGCARVNFAGTAQLSAPSTNTLLFQNAALTDFGRLQLGGTTSAFPAIKRNGAGIDIRLADDSAFAPLKGKLTTDTNYTAGVPSATGYLTIYDATGTAYRVPCTV